MKCKAPEFIVAGTVESGKTHPMLHRLYRLHCEIPNLVTFIARKQRVDMRKSVLDQFENEVLPYNPQHPSSPCKVYGGNEPREYHWHNGGKTHIFGIDKPEALLGSLFDAGYVCQAEQLSLQEWEMLSHRCGRAGNWILDGKRFGQLWADCNPDVASHWILKREAQGKLKMFQVSFKDNIIFFQDDDWTELGTQRKSLLERTMTGTNHRRMILGEWCSSEGLVFPEFDPQVHIINELPEWVYNDPKTLWYLGVDYGHSSAFVACWFAYNRQTDVLISVLEWRKAETLIRDHIAKIKEVSKDKHIANRISDHDSQMNHELSAAGIPTEPANKGAGSILRGLDLMRIRLRDKKLLLYKDQLIERDPLLEQRHAVRDGIEEIQNYRHKEEKKHVGDSTKDDVPIKGDDHWIDVARYVIDFLDNNTRLMVEPRIASANQSKWRRF